MRPHRRLLATWLLGMLVFSGCARQETFQIHPSNIQIRLPSANFTLYADGRVELRTANQRSSGGATSSFLEIKDHAGAALALLLQFGQARISSISDSLGEGTGLIIPGTLSERFQMKLDFRVYPESFPDVLLATFTVENASSEDLLISQTNFLHLSPNALDFGSREAHAFWSFQGASYESRPDWILPLKPDFYQENFMGMNASDYGGGIPVVDLWAPHGGIAIAHLSRWPQRVAFPVRVSEENGVEIFMRDNHHYAIASGDSLQSLPTAIIFHKGDYFNALTTFRRLMEKRGYRVPEFSPWAYEPSWCAWGYERDFKLSEIEGTLSKVKELGFKWVTLDDGWQTANGDWRVRADKYPGGEEGLKAFIRELHSQGFKVQLWWVPFDVSPKADLIKQHPDWLLLNEKGEKQKISWWDTYYLDPSYGPVIEYTRRLIQKFFTEWDLDGLKIDGQHLNAAPPCYNPAHNHRNPEESYRGTPAFFKMIFEEARKVKPNALIQICPCGDVFSFYHMPYLNQPVASDPLSSWQIRLKGKTYKALMGSNVPYYGDHVELSDNGDDFASQIGIGGIPGSKFTWPLYPRLKNNTFLTPQREELFGKWLRLYNQMELSKGQYINVYDMGWDNPEGHLIVKDGIHYYAFFTRKEQNLFSGTIELRGLEDGKTYRVRDYWNDKPLGSVAGPVGKLSANFERFLFLEAQ